MSTIITVPITGTADIDTSQLPQSPSTPGTGGTIRPVVMQSEELVTANIAVTTGSPPAWYAFRRIVAYDVKAGEVFDLRARFKLRNDTGVNVQFTPTVVRFPSPGLPPSTGSVPGFGLTDAHYVCQPIGDNVTPSDHYVKDDITGIWEADQDYEYMIFFMAGSAASTAATSGMVLVNEHWHLQFTALRFT